MDCPTAKTLVDEFAVAAMEYFTAVDKLSNLVRSHYHFSVAKEHTEQAGAKCKLARLALEKHRVDHNCNIPT